MLIGTGPGGLKGSHISLRGLSHTMGLAEGSHLFFHLLKNVYCQQSAGL